MHSDLATRLVNAVVTSSDKLRPTGFVAREIGSIRRGVSFDLGQITDAAEQLSVIVTWLCYPL